MDTATKNENIIELYGRIAHGSKTKTLRAIARTCGRAVATVKNHWILGEEVPEKHQDEVIELLQSVLKEQQNSQA